MPEYLGYDRQRLIQAKKITGKTVPQSMGTMLSLFEAYICLPHVSGYHCAHSTSIQSAIRCVGGDEQIWFIDIGASELQVLNDGNANLFRPRQFYLFSGLLL